MSSSTPPTTETESEIYISTFLTDNPDLDKELGDVFVMTDRYTNAEWAAQIAETQKKVLHEIKERGQKGAKGWEYEVPKAASSEFAQTIDHTVLKLDVKKEGIDALCAEARTEGFKVGHVSCSLCSYLGSEEIRSSGNMWISKLEIHHTNPNQSKQTKQSNPCYVCIRKQLLTISL